MTTSRTLTPLVCGLSAALLSATLVAQQPALETIELRPNFFVLAGAGGNIGVQVGNDGVVVVDAGSAASGDAVVAAIKKITLNPIRYVINTGPDADHVGGNERVAQAGQTIFQSNGLGGVNPLLQGLTNGGAASVLAAEGVLRRMSAPTGQAAPFPSAAWPTETFHDRRKYMYLNGEGIEVLHQPAAHSDSDVIVFFRRSDVVMAGDLIDTRRFPVIDVDKGGSVQGLIDALTKLVEIAIPSVPLVASPEPGTYVVPGHGRIYEQVDVADYRDMVTVIRDRVQDLMGKGMTLDRIKAAKPTAGYTARYGASSGAWTTDLFVEAVFRSLQKEAK